MQTINLDVSIKTPVPTLYFKQKNVGSEFAARLFENAKAFNVDGNSFSVWYSGKSGDGNYSTIDGETAFFIDGNEVRVEMIAQMVNSPGKHEMCLIMNDSEGNQIGFWNIPYCVEAIPGADSEEATQYFNELAGAAEEAKNAANYAEIMAGIAANAANSVSNPVSYKPQTLTEEEKEQARENIGAAAIGDGGGSSVARYETFYDALAEGITKEDGNILAYTSSDGEYHIKLLADYATEYTTIINRDCTIHLNGYTLDFVSASACFVVTNAKLTINGEVEGSVLRKVGLTGSSDTIQDILSATNSDITLNKGLYVFSDVTGSKAAVAFDIEGGPFTMQGCTVESHNPDFGNVVYIVRSKGEVNVKNCKINATAGKQFYGIFTEDNLKIADTEINGELTQTGTDNNTFIIGAYLMCNVKAQYSKKVMKLDNCKINVSSPIYGSVIYGATSYVLASGVTPTYDNVPLEMFVNNCDIEADGFADYYVGEKHVSVTVSAITCGEWTKLYINGGSYWGKRDAILPQGVVRIDGGVYGGCQHGGAYFASEKAYVRNATFCNTDPKRYEHKNGQHGCVYCDNKNGKMFFDHCRFVVTAPFVHHGITAKGDGSGLNVYLSNCEFVENVGVMESNLRADWGETIFIGKNVEYKTVAKPENDDPEEQNFAWGTIDTETYAGAEFGFNTESYLEYFGDVRTFVEDKISDWIEKATFGVNSYKIEGGGASTYYHTTREETGQEPEAKGWSEYIWGLYDWIPGVVKKEVKSDDKSFTNYTYEISTGEYSTEGSIANTQGYGKDLDIKKPKYLILTGYHGIERNAALSAYRFICDVVNGHNVPPAFKEGVVINVFPVANPSSFDEFTYVEGPYLIKDDKQTLEQEKQGEAIKNWLSDNSDADLFIDFHNGNQLNEIAAICGNSDYDSVKTAKKIAMKGIDRIIPYWKDVIRYPATVEDRIAWKKQEDGTYKITKTGYEDIIYSYCADVAATKRVPWGYAQTELNITSICIEAFDFYGDYSAYNEKMITPQSAYTYPSPKNNGIIEAIAAGAEIMGNILLEFYAQSVAGSALGDIESALAGIIAIQNSYIEGGAQ